MFHPLLPPSECVREKQRESQPPFCRSVEGKLEAFYYRFVSNFTRDRARQG